MPTFKTIAPIFVVALALSVGGASAEAGFMPHLHGLEPTASTQQADGVQTTVSTQQVLINRTDICTQLELSAGLRGADCGVMSAPELVEYYLDKVS